MSFKTKVIISALGGLAMTGIVSATATPRTDFDAAAEYTKCKGCHGAKAEKKFDKAKADDELVQVILKGKKAEKPPNMPGYETKGITAEKAKALVDYMRSLNP
ncbi:MAG TPA: c-type cytochrome [Pyrinomonadaceae bacterium]|nr:c-type cytochrome [Pyrinomonadaceae bacterium]